MGKTWTTTTLDDVWVGDIIEVNNRTGRVSKRERNAQGRIEYYVEKVGTVEVRDPNQQIQVYR